MWSFYKAIPTWRRSNDTSFKLRAALLLYGCVMNHGVKLQNTTTSQVSPLLLAYENEEKSSFIRQRRITLWLIIRQILGLSCYAMSRTPGGVTAH
jgi:hypothetical protein